MGAISADLPVDEFTSLCPLYVDPETSLDEIIDLMREERIRHVPVVSGTRAVGIISERDLKMIENYDFARKFTAKDLMVEDPYSVTSGTPLVDVAFHMSQQKIGACVVNDTNGAIMGIFTSIDGMNALVEVLRGEIL